MTEPVCICRDGRVVKRGGVWWHRRWWRSFTCGNPIVRVAPGRWE